MSPFSFRGGETSPDKPINQVVVEFSFPGLACIRALTANGNVSRRFPQDGRPPTISSFRGTTRATDALSGLADSRSLSKPARLPAVPGLEASSLFWCSLLCVPGVIAEPPSSADLRTSAQSPAPEAPITLDELARQPRRREEQNAKLAEQNQSLVKQLDAVTKRCDQLNQRLEQIEPHQGTSTTATPFPLPPELGFPADPARPARADSRPVPELDDAVGLPASESPAPPGLPQLTQPARPSFSRFLAGEYDDERGQFVLVRPRDEQRVPFEPRLDIFTQARYCNFARNTSSWVDSTGAKLPAQSFNSGEINRNFIRFSGFGIDPRLQFTAFIFSSTTLNDTVYLGWINYHSRF